MIKMHLAGLLTYSMFIAFPTQLGSGMKNEHLIELTATGIVTELHRASLLIPSVSGTEYSTKVRAGWFNDK